MKAQPRGEFDHLVLGTADLGEGVSRVADLLGVEPAFGGRHERWGTANYLLSLGPAAYLEIVGPDPAGRPAGEPSLFGIGVPDEPRLLTWVARHPDLNALVEGAGKCGVQLGPVHSGSRRQPGGAELRWEATDPGAFPCDGLVPFFIDWGSTVHPARTAPVGGTLLSFGAEHPDPSLARKMFRCVGVRMEVEEGPNPALVARIETVSGEEVELR